MVIGIAMYTANTMERTGVAWYVFYLIKYMARICPAGVTLRLYVDRPLVSDFFPLPDCVEVRVLNHPLRYMWTHTRLAYELWRHPIDVLFVPSHVLPLFCRVPMVMVIHDVAALHVPHTYSLVQRWYSIASAWFALKRAQTIIVPSIATKTDVCKIRSKKIPNISVIPLAVDTQRHCAVSLDVVQTTLSELSITAPYFLFVGRLESKKNVHGILRAYEIFRQSNTTRVQLVLVGKPGVGYEYIEQIYHEHPYKDDIVLKSAWAAQGVIQALYAGATACVYPSLYEGFGLNVLESLAYGVPAIVSDAGSLSELGAECVLRVSAQDIGEIARAMTTVYADTLFLAYVKQNGPVYTKTYTWDRTAQQTLQVLMGVVL
jgi:glycosyltransferase involved in cell wall biosynthesis